MIQLFIDDQLADIDLTSGISISLSVSTITSLDSSSTGYTKTLELPMTLRNRAIIGDFDQINSTTMFNQQSHTARIEVDGQRVIDGQLMMTSVSRYANSGTYYAVIIGSSRLWVSEASANMINEIDVDFSCTISDSTIVQSWTWDDPVRMLPVMRDGTFDDNVSSYAYVPVRIFSVRDYHPFLHVKTMLKAIIESAGYSIISDFIETEYFDTLYISGAYSQRDVDAIKEKMDFYAGCFSSKSSTANLLGRVYANPSVASCSIGNIVDTADPLEQSDDGSYLSGVYNVDNCFYKKNGLICFVPPSEVDVSFELDIEYLTDYYLLSRDELTGFNEIYLDSFQSHTFKLINRFVDKKESIFSGYDYKGFVFDHQDGNTYKLCYRVQVDGSEDYLEYTYSTFSARTFSFNIDSSNTLIDTVLYQLSSSGVYETCSLDWAVYDGSVEEHGVVEVHICVRSQTETLSAGEAKYFSSFYFGGADTGMGITVLDTTTLRPVFSPHPGLGTTIEFADVAQHSYRQIVLVNAIKHLFDLCFYTDSQNKEVYIEPRKNFYDNAVIVDWSDKIDFSKEISYLEMGDELSAEVNIGYLDGDGAVARWNETTKQKFGEHTFDISNLFADSDELDVLNPLFCPTINTTGVFTDALDATFVQVGDRDDPDYMEEDLNFPAKVVRYMGMQDLPDNQVWGWPSYDPEYPVLGFHSEDYDIGSLCFEDRDSLVGLHEYYDGTFDIYNNSKKVTLYLRLRPQDIEPLVIINSQRRDFRALFKLELSGETALFYLDEICDYNPISGDSVKCVFIKKV